MSALNPVFALRDVFGLLLVLMTFHQFCDEMLTRIHSFGRVFDSFMLFEGH